MRDNGPRRSFHIRRSNFFLLMILFLCLPFLCLLLAIQCWLLWHENVDLRLSMERAEADYQAVESRAARLENLEELLKEENTRGREVIIRQLAESDPQSERAAEENGDEETGSDSASAESLQGLDSGRVKISNVQMRILRGNALRISLDLRNLENDSLLSGEVEASLLLSNGSEHELVFNPREAGAFRIARFKRTVLTAQAPKDVILADARLVLQVKEQGGKLLFRHLYPVNQ